MQRLMTISAPKRDSKPASRLEKSQTPPRPNTPTPPRSLIPAPRPIHSPHRSPTSARRRSPRTAAPRTAASSSSSPSAARSPMAAPHRTAPLRAPPLLPPPRPGTELRPRVPSVPEAAGCRGGRRVGCPSAPRSRTGSRVFLRLSPTAVLLQWIRPFCVLPALFCSHLSKAKGCLVRKNNRM